MKSLAATVAAQNAMAGNKRRRDARPHFTGTRTMREKKTLKNLRDLEDQHDDEVVSIKHKKTKIVQLQKELLRRKKDALALLREKSHKNDLEWHEKTQGKCPSCGESINSVDDEEFQCPCCMFYLQADHEASKDRPTFVIVCPKT